MPVKRWNFSTAKWNYYIALTNNFAKTWLPSDLLDVDAAFQDFVTSLTKLSKRLSHAVIKTTIFRVGIWSESVYKTFLQSPHEDNLSLAATALFARLDRKRRDRWSDAVQSIDFSQSSRKTWSILNNLTGRSGNSPLHCYVSADAIASKLVKNWRYEAVDCKSFRLVSQEVSDL